MNENVTAVHPVTESRVAVLGLGAMGTALARALADAGHEVVVWNRSPKDLAALGLDGTRPASDPADAVRGVRAVIICVRDHLTSRPLVERVSGGLPPDVPVVNLSTGTSDQAVGSALAASALGVRYVTGAIMVPTPLIGTDDNLVLYAGSAPALDAAMPVLRDLGGTVDVLGEDHAVPPALDMAMLDVFFSGMFAFLHSAAMVRAHGIEPTAYLPYAAAITATLAGELDGLATAVEQGKYDRGQASLEMCLSFLDHVVATSEASGVDAALPRLVRDATRRRLDRGPGNIDWESVAEGFTSGAAR